MNRDYLESTEENIQFFFGKEVEHTPAFGMDTLFVVGVHHVEKIKENLEKTTYETRHIFFGANHSYDPISIEHHMEWEAMIEFFLNEGYLCSLDIPINQAEEFNESGLNEYDNFIPQIRIPIPYIKLWNYNTMIKIDDNGFNSTNPGIWSHSLHSLTDREFFTSWREYKNDKIIK